MTQSSSRPPFGHGATAEPRKAVVPVPIPQAAPAPEPPPVDEGKGIIEYLPDLQAQRLTPDQKKGLLGAISADGFVGFTPMICRDAECPMYEKCPLVRLQITRPVGDDCPIEAAQVGKWQKRLFEVLPPEEQGDPFNLMLVNDIALLQLLEQRALVKLGVDASLEQSVVVGTDKAGNALKGRAVHIAMQVYEKVSKIKTKLMGKLLQTPQDRVKAAAAGMHDRSRQAAALMERMKELAAERARNTPEIKDADFRILEARPKGS